MKWHRIEAILIRHLYLYQRSLPRWMDIFYWPIMDVLLWGFLSLYLAKLNRGDLSIISVLLGALLFWNLIQQSQQAVSVAFLEEVWEKNLLNIFVTPLKVSEFLSATLLLGLIRIVFCSLVMTVLAFLLYHFNILIIGIYLVPFFASLLFFGLSIGVFTTAIILRYGNSAEILAWGFIFIIQPFTAVFYPVSALPSAVRHISYLIPTTYVFEGMRQVLHGGNFSMDDFSKSLGLNILCMIFAVWFFYAQFARVKEKATLSKLD